MATYSASGSLQKITVGSTGSFRIVGYGAQGGSASAYNASGTYVGGSGAEVGGTFSLQKGEVLELFVGQQGGTGSISRIAGGGGGGTFVLADVDAQGNLTPGTYRLLLAAGGGGGASEGASGSPGGDATLFLAGDDGRGGAAGGGPVGPNGGNGPNYGAGGGAGFKADGGTATSGSGSQYGRGGTRVTSPINPGAGGVYNGTSNATVGNGGFGGGGSGGGGADGGGGGGYSGGAGGGTTYAGAGGSSYFSTSGVRDLAAVGNTGDGFVTITPDAACFAAGTLIRTVRGEIAIEALRVGDLVATASGDERRIRWLGHRTLDCRSHPRPPEVLPVLIRAHALGANRPARDLLVSPGHSFCFDLLGEVLVPAFALVNGATIAQMDVETITYWHVELDSHDIILAENAPAESYLDCGNRSFFAVSGVVALEASPAALLTTRNAFLAMPSEDRRSA